MEGNEQDENKSTGQNPLEECDNTPPQVYLSEEVWKALAQKANGVKPSSELAASTSLQTTLKLQSGFTASETRKSLLAKLSDILVVEEVPTEVCESSCANDASENMNNLPEKVHQKSAHMTKKGTKIPPRLKTKCDVCGDKVLNVTKHRKLVHNIHDSSPNVRPSPSGKAFACPICGNEFSQYGIDQAQRLLDHIKEDHGQARDQEYEPNLYCHNLQYKEVFSCNDLRHKAKVEELEALHNITIPLCGVAGNCPVEGCGKWLQHLRTHIVSMHTPKEACKYCGVEIFPRYMKEHVKLEHEGLEVLKYKEVQCPICHTTLQLYGLKKHFFHRHKQSKEDAEKLYFSLYPRQRRSPQDPNAPQCPICENRVKDMRKHISKVHKGNPDDYMMGKKLLPGYDVDYGKEKDEKSSNPCINQLKKSKTKSRRKLKPEKKVERTLTCPICNMVVERHLMLKHFMDVEVHGQTWSEAASICRQLGVSTEVNKSQRPNNGNRDTADPEVIMLSEYNDPSERKPKRKKFWTGKPENLKVDQKIERVYGIKLPPSGVGGKCPICLADTKHLRTHIVESHGPKHPCPHCGQIFKRFRLGKHVREAHQNLPDVGTIKIDCPICNETLQRHSLRRHFIAVHEQSYQEATVLYHRVSESHNIQYKPHKSAKLQPNILKKHSDDYHEALYVIVNQKVNISPV